MALVGLMLEKGALILQWEGWYRLHLARMGSDVDMRKDELCISCSLHSLNSLPKL
jgi:hypothetical protein